VCVCVSVCPVCPVCPATVLDPSRKMNPSGMAKGFRMWRALYVVPMIVVRMSLGYSYLFWVWQELSRVDRTKRWGTISVQYEMVRWLFVYFRELS
jgi:hypothetical protein